MKLDKKAVDKGLVAYREFQSPRKTVSAVITAYLEALEAGGKAWRSVGYQHNETFPALIIRMEE